jgi:alkylated DNA repair dioxygenase AlkB
VTSIKQRLCDLTNLNFNSVLLNYYRDGHDSVAWHADDEPELGADPIIASVSLGAERDFQLCPKNSSSRAVKVRLKLRNGSLLVMGKGMQNNWLHQVPKAKTISNARVNLTFRNINPTA